MGGGPANPVIIQAGRGDINSITKQTKAIELGSTTESATSAVVETSWGDTDDEDAGFASEDSESEDDEMDSDSEMNMGAAELEELRVQEARVDRAELRADAGKPGKPNFPDYTKELDEPSWGDDDDEEDEDESMGDLENYDEADGPGVLDGPDEDVDDIENEEDGKDDNSDANMDLDEEIRDLCKSPE